MTVFLWNFKVLTKIWPFYKTIQHARCFQNFEKFSFRVNQHQIVLESYIRVRFQSYSDTELFQFKVTSAFFDTPGITRTIDWKSFLFGMIVPYYQMRLHANFNDPSTFRSSAIDSRRIFQFLQLKLLPHSVNIDEYFF